MPHWVWKNWENGKIRMITEGMRGSMVGVGEKQEREDRQNRLVQYLIETMHMHTSYAFGYFFCEALNFVNVVSKQCNIMLMTNILQGVSFKINITIHILFHISKEDLFIKLIFSQNRMFSVLLDRNALY